MDCTKCLYIEVHIGRGCVIGVGSIVTRDIPDYHVVVGNPARLIKKWDFDKNCYVKI